MDGIHADTAPRMLLIAATNRKEMLDSALLRPGRFDRHIEVDLPDKKARHQILNIHARNKPLADTVELEKVAAEVFGFSGAQLESVMNEGAIYAMREKAEVIEAAASVYGDRQGHDGREDGPRDDAGGAGAGGDA